jgi:hypothetical protein
MFQRVIADTCGALAQGFVFGQCRQGIAALQHETVTGAPQCLFQDRIIQRPSRARPEFMAE